MTADVLIHIGYPKAASSFLQETVFDASPELYKIPPELAKTVDLSRLFEATDDVIPPDERRRRAAILRDHAMSQSRTVVLSDESFCMGAWLPDMTAAAPE